LCRRGRDRVKRHCRPAPPLARSGAGPYPLGMNEFIIRPDPDDPRLSTAVRGIDQSGAEVETRVVTERPLTLFLNGQEIVTMMTIGDRPDLLAVGYLLNQGMLQPDDEISAIEHDEDLELVVV